MAFGSLKSYDRMFDRVFTAAQNALCVLGYKIDSIDKSNGLITFKTDRSWRSWAGQEMSVLLVIVGDGRVEVCVAGCRIQSFAFFQLFDWYEVAGIAKRVLSEMDEYLGTGGDVSW